MRFIVVTNEWMSAHGIMPLPTMRKSKDGSKVILHEDYFRLLARKDEEGNPLLDGAEVYAHNSTALNDLLASDEWGYGDEETPTGSADFIQAAAVKNLMAATRAGIQTMSLTDKEALEVKDLYPTFDDVLEDYKGNQLPAGFKLTDGCRLYKVIQAHTPQADWRPGDVPALFGLVSGHDGTLDDPIPYEHWMLLEAGKYYTENGVTYLCTRSLDVGYDSDLSGLAQFVQRVE